jgi:steroid delta-isomerase
MNPTHVQRYIDAFERLTPSTLQPLEDCFAEGARFVDPFNDVSGRSQIRAVFEHMFASCEDPQFDVDECLSDDGLAYLRWHFSFGNPASRRRVEGVSRVQFAPDGRVTEHRDYWDPASQLYEEIPLLGRLFRVLRKRLAAPRISGPDSNSPSSATT